MAKTRDQGVIVMFRACQGLACALMSPACMQPAIGHCVHMYTVGFKLTQTAGVEPMSTARQAVCGYAPTHTL
jgi:hypothetical protein